jgi:hypothetical protein
MKFCFCILDMKLAIMHSDQIVRRKKKKKRPCFPALLDHTERCTFPGECFDHLTSREKERSA